MSGHPVVAIIPAKDRADTVAATVRAVRQLDGVDRILVVDDGSTDGTAAAARSAGARVLVLPRNLGKGGAMSAGVAAEPAAGTYLLLDADVGGTAQMAGALLPPVLSGQADMTVAVLPAAGGRAGFGLVRDLARAGIRRASGFEATAPLSGQRAVDGALLRSLLPLAPRFGLETALTIDARRAGGRVLEVPVAMDHRHTGRRLAGFRHRAAQGGDIVRALWPRLTSTGQRLAAIGLVFVVLGGVALYGGSTWEPASEPPTHRPGKVVLFGIPGLAWSDVGSGRMPNLDGLIDRGAVAAMSVRTLSGSPTPAEGYATLGAGTRVMAGAEGADAFEASEAVEGGTADDALARRTGARPDGRVVVVGAPATARLNEGRHLSSRVGALGQALRAAGRRTAVIGNADIPVAIQTAETLRPPRARPAPIALMSAGGDVDGGAVGPELLQEDPVAPFGIRADPAVLELAATQALADAEVVLIDPGDLDRAAVFAASATPAVAAEARANALAHTDALLGRIISLAGPDALVLVISVVPPGDKWHLTPVVAAGAGVRPGYLHSISTRRLGVVTLTDLAPTVLDAVGAPQPDGMIGHALRYHPGPASIDRLRRIDRDAFFRESIYLRLTLAYIALQAIAYLLAIVAFTRLGGVGRAGRVLRAVVLGVAAWPLATFALRAIPNVAELGGGAVGVLLAIDAAIVWLASRARRHPLSPLVWITGSTVAVLCIDVWTGATLQTSSLLGYSLHTAARFTGLGNTAFAALASCAILTGAIHVHDAPRRLEAVVTAALLFALVVLTDGAPSLGSDVGGILTLVPVFGLLILVLTGRRVSWRVLAAAAGVTLAALVVAAGLDYLRPVEARTHLGRLVADMQDRGLAPFRNTVGRKITANLRTFRSPWTWTIPIIAGYMLWMVAWTRGLGRVLPRGSALRAGTVAVLAAGILGNVVNDSGVVITALVFVFLGPFLTLLALEGEQGEPLVLEPAAPVPAAEAG